jgi:energy-coupling factor transporter ATP-binding protein EcfA2
MVIKLDNVSFAYPGREVLRGVSLEVGSGDFLGITGPTGSGKSTLAYCLNGLIPHSIRGKLTGTVRVCGMDVRSRKVADMARKVGFVFQDPDWQIFSLSVADEVSFGLRNLKMGRNEERVRDALRMAGLEGYKDEPPHNLSHGQKQKLCIASVIAMEPDVIVLDEPTSQLDYGNTLNIYDLLRGLNRKGKTIVAIEHDTDILAEYAKRVLVLDGGRTSKVGKARDVLSDRKLLRRLGIKVPGVCR